MGGYKQTMMDKPPTKFIGLSCPRCYTRHTIPIPDGFEESSTGCNISCGCGKNIVLIIGELNLMSTVMACDHIWNPSLICDVCSISRMNLDKLRGIIKK
jgi:hypothetical protein